MDRRVKPGDDNAAENGDQPRADFRLNPLIPQMKSGVALEA
jgi:hypothetical protein